MECRDVAVGVVLRRQLVLITRRREIGPLAGMWEFPGGKCEAGETPEHCLKRELWEELEILAKPVMLYSPIFHNYAHGAIRLHPYLCLHEAGEPKLIGCADARWIAPLDLRQYRFPEANATLVEQIIGSLPTPRLAPPTLSTIAPTGMPRRAVSMG